MFTEIQIVELMRNLAEKRPVFHSEADFQHELAWLIRAQNPSIEVRLERPLPNVGEVDILLRKDDVEFLVELKYKTQACQCENHGESFSLKSHGAQPLGRYDGIKDISRIERSRKGGCTIFLTNESQYWRVNAGGNGAQFSIKEGRDVGPCVLEWRDNTKTKSIGADRVEGIPLLGSYRFQWRDYSLLGQGEPFRYLLVMVSAGLA